MPNYTFRCPYDQEEFIHYLSFDDYNQTIFCPMHPNVPLQKVLGVNILSSFQDGYNPSVGKYIPNRASLLSEFSKASDAATERTGIPHKYVPVDMHPDAVGVTEEGLDDTIAADVRRGKREVRRWF